MVLKIAHRGYSDKLQGNCYQSIQRAINHNFDMIEVDIQLNADNTLVLYHDIIHENLEVEIDTLNDLECLKEKILFLSTFFSMMRNNKKMIYLDLKGKHNTCVFLKRFLKFYEDLFDRIYISSFAYEHCEYFFDMPIRIGYSTCNTFQVKNSDFFNKLSFISIDMSVINDAIIQLCHNNNKQIFVFTCKKICDINYVMKFKIDGIFSNILFDKININ